MTWSTIKATLSICQRTTSQCPLTAWQDLITGRDFIKKKKEKKSIFGTEKKGLLRQLKVI